ncbi:unnamed protein product [Bursaphelenchus okinawaensis]|uniref:Peptidase C1A papain C-terminal domain-containing protein n=1 Tax=Bursaphelenchus okinawaensis TaxID=465554 RepID=A0A811JVQ8_9BILA|nr:unnamed protein product [Bursaphelenchus okinawaensis]CAG9085270.1 unnamed protein product [Bursaphelenchus okinawaensis]
MYFKVPCLLLFTIVAKAFSQATKEISAEAAALTGQKLVDYINSLGTTWTATFENRFRSVPRERFVSFLGQIDDPSIDLSNFGQPLTSRAHIKLPEHFDAREKWPECKSIRTITDQSSCGNCWAVSSASAISDRICIGSHGKKQVIISAQDLTSCCPFCGAGCFGGDMRTAFHYYARYGIVSGGAYNDNETCRPYPFAPCDHDVTPGKYPECPDTYSETPKCERKCVNGSKIEYEKDRHYGVYPFSVHGEDAMMKEIYVNGPVASRFLVFEDYFYYKSGIYQHVGGGEPISGHAVRIIGWGVENGTKYWLIANSWNEDWGEKGLFRMLRGTSHLKIELFAGCALPKL